MTFLARLLPWVYESGLANLRQELFPELKTKNGGCWMQPLSGLQDYFPVSQCRPPGGHYLRRASMGFMTQSLWDRGSRTGAGCTGHRGGRFVNRGKAALKQPQSRRFATVGRRAKWPVPVGYSPQVSAPQADRVAARHCPPCRLVSDGVIADFYDCFERPTRYSDPLDFRLY